jgi:hypothetical protein
MAMAAMSPRLIASCRNIPTNKIRLLRFERTFMHLKQILRIDIISRSDVKLYPNEINVDLGKTQRATNFYLLLIMASTHGF